MITCDHCGEENFFADDTCAYCGAILPEPDVVSDTMDDFGDGTGGQSDYLPNGELEPDDGHYE